LVVSFFPTAAPNCPKHMSNNQKAQKSENIFEQQQNPKAGDVPHGGVRQDKRATDSARTASPQASRLGNIPRAQSMKKNGVRTASVNTLYRKKGKLTLWVNPIVKAELQRRAARNGLSISAAGAALLERALQQSIDMEYGALLAPVIREQIHREMRTYSSQIVKMLVRVAYAAEQTRSLVTNILGRMAG
jgi:hypothetical protein